MRKILLSLVTIAVVSASSIGTTRAYFTDSGSSTGNSIASGHLDISAAPGTAVFTYSELQPGWGFNDPDDWTISKDFTISNSGTLPLKYQVRLATTDNNALLDNVRVKIKLQKGVSNNTMFDGTLKGLLAGVALDSNFAVGDPEQTVTMYTRILPTAGSDIEDLTLHFDLVFEATQINNTGWN